MAKFAPKSQFFSIFCSLRSQKIEKICDTRFTADEMKYWVKRPLDRMWFGSDTYPLDQLKPLNFGKTAES